MLQIHGCIQITHSAILTPWDQRRGFWLPQRVQSWSCQKCPPSHAHLCTHLFDIFPGLDSLEWYAQLFHIFTFFTKQKGARETERIVLPSHKPIGIYIRLENISYCSLVTCSSLQASIKKSQIRIELGVQEKVMKKGDGKYVKNMDMKNA